MAVKTAGKRTGPGRAEPPAHQDGRHIPRSRRGRTVSPKWLLLLAFLLACGCGDGSREAAPPAEEARSAQQPAQAEVPVVTLKHWRDSTPGERYSFLIGFVTMLELEKEWQGRVGGRILPFEQSLVESWTIGFAHRPLAEIYNGLNEYLSEHPGELDRPAAEVMWFIFVQPRLKEREKVPDPAGDEAGQERPDNGPE